MPPNKTRVRRRHAGAEPVRRQRRRAAGRSASARFAGPLNVAFGAEYPPRELPDSRGRAGLVSATAASRISSAAARRSARRCFPGFRPSNEVDESRNSVAGYVDVEGDVIDWLRLGGAGPRGALQRLRQHGGRQADGARAARSAASWCAASVSTGFRAPSLGQSFFSSTATNFLNSRAGARAGGVADAAGRLRAGAGARRRAAQAGAARCNVSAGVVIAPIAAFDITVDYYRIAIDDRIVLSGNFTGAADRRAARAVRRQQRAVLHQRDRHADQRRRRDGQLSRRARTPRATCACAPATTTRARRSSARSPRRRSSPASSRCCSIASSGGGSNAVSRRTACGSAATGG